MDNRCDLPDITDTIFTANAPSVPSPNNTSRAPVPPHPAPHMHHIPPQGNMHHHHLHHAGDSYVTIGFDFVIGPEAPPLGPRDANPPQADATSNTTQDRPSTPSVDDRINTFSAGNLHVTPESVPHQAEARGLPSVNNSGAEQGMLGGVEFHAIGVDIGIDDSDLDPSAFSDDEFIEFARMMNVRPPTDSQTPNNNPNPDVPVTQPHSQFDSRATPNVAANNQQPGASSNTPPNHNAQPNSNVSPRLPDLSGYFNSMFSAAIPGTAGPRRPQNFARGGPRAHSAARGSSRPQERRTWVPPPPPGPTLRQTIERREREAGLRCWDVSCGLAPDDDCPLREIPEELKRQVRIRQETAASASSSQEGSGDSKGKGKEKAEKDPEPQYVCEHSFHTPCLVTAQRVALNGADEVVLEEGKSVEVSCPICRASGMMPRDDWEDGVRSLESDLD
ncbi:hypothetical protein J3R30DRAFT_2849243 [Lentinula aciculospora]|uniref:Uncharacterized protein n=1 Tax=Lentinula aciculospora TaxID=153920 RepID=A0A9W9AA30_9AGAR|nr:hypothetical protein J3R30DRAFT_2849243 [Lentinula aciculospora]